MLHPTNNLISLFDDFEVLLGLDAMESLPVIDFSNPDRHELAKELTKAMEVVGFVYLDNVPGYNREVEEKLYKAASWFFSLPLDEKLRVSPRRWNKDAAGVYRGYVPMRQLICISGNSMK